MSILVTTVFPILSLGSINSLISIRMPRPRWEIDSIFFMHELRLALSWIWATEYTGSDVLELLSPGFNRSGNFCFLHLKTATILGGTQTTGRDYMKHNPQALIHNSSWVSIQSTVSTNCQPRKWATLQVSTQASPPNGHHLNWYHWSGRASQSSSVNRWITR